MPSPQPPRAVFAMDPVHLPLLFPPPLMARLSAGGRHRPGAGRPGLHRPHRGRRPGRGRSTDHRLGLPAPRRGCPHRGHPELRAVLHAAGSVRSLVGEALWERGITVSSAVTGNALPVAEYTLAMILLLREGHLRPPRALPRHPHLSLPRRDRRHRERRPADRRHRRLPGGPAAAGAAAAVRLHGPAARPVRQPRRGDRPRRRTRCSLEDLLRHSDIVSLHAPDIPETYRMLDARPARPDPGRRRAHQHLPRRPGRPRRPHRRAGLRPAARGAGRHRARTTPRRVAAVPAAQRVPHPAHRRLARQRTGAARPDRRRGTRAAGGGRLPRRTRCGTRTWPGWRDRG